MAVAENKKKIAFQLQWLPVYAVVNLHRLSLLQSLPLNKIPITLISLLSSLLFPTRKVRYCRKYTAFLAQAINRAGEKWKIGEKNDKNRGEIDQRSHRRNAPGCSSIWAFSVHRSASTLLHASASGTTLTLFRPGSV